MESLLACKAPAARIVLRHASGTLPRKNNAYSCLPSNAERLLGGIIHSGMLIGILTYFILDACDHDTATDIGCSSRSH